VAGTGLQDCRLPRHQGWIYGAPVKYDTHLESSLSVDMLLSAVSVLVIVLQSPEIPEGLMNSPVLVFAVL
jgi:hypothetical protein